MQVTLLFLLPLLIICIYCLTLIATTHGTVSMLMPVSCTAMWPGELLPSPLADFLIFNSPFLMGPFLKLPPLLIICWNNLFLIWYCGHCYISLHICPHCHPCCNHHCLLTVTLTMLLWHVHHYPICCICYGQLIIGFRYFYLAFSAIINECFLCGANI